MPQSLRRRLTATGQAGRGRFAGLAWVFALLLTTSPAAGGAAAAGPPMARTAQGPVVPGDTTGPRALGRARLDVFRRYSRSGGELSLF
jgi:hypothetical protein